MRKEAGQKENTLWSQRFVLTFLSACAIPLLTVVMAAQVSRVANPETGDVETIVKRAATAINTLKSLHLTAAVVMETSGVEFKSTSESKLTIAVEQPSKFHIQNAGMGGTTKISDGSQTWTYQRSLKQYTKKAAPETFLQALSAAHGNFLSPELGLATKSAKRVGDEEISIEGKAYSCYVLQVEPPEPSGKSRVHEQAIRLWIDKSTYLILKRTSESRFDDWPPTGGRADLKASATVVSLRVNQPLSPALFVFEPPPSAKLVSDLRSPNSSKSDLVGKPAPAFVLRDLTNREVKLTDLRGKIVLLDFWATWCGPCREAIPLLESIHQRNEDVIVVGINVGEELQKVSDFVATNKITYRVLLAGNDQVVSDFGAQGLPTAVIVDKEGIIRAHKVGYGSDSEAQLQAALREAREPRAAVGPTSVSPTRVNVYKGPVHRIGDGVSAPSVITPENDSDEILIQVLMFRSGL